MHVIKFPSWTDGHLLKKCTENSAIKKATSVTWAQYIRDLFVQWVWEDVILAEIKFDGIVEIDESLFGRKIIPSWQHMRTAKDLGRWTLRRPTILWQIEAWRL